jgi:hypothetical protein
MRRSEEVLHTFQHHVELLAGVQTRVQALFDATEHMSALDSKREDLVEFLRRRVLPHAELEEHTFYEIGSQIFSMKSKIASPVPIIFSSAS